MELFLGGRSQGKLNYVRNIHPEIALVLDGENMDLDANSLENIKEPFILNHFHILVKRLLEEETDAYDFTEKLINLSPNSVIISDEIGNGIVPMEKSERAWRETTGRLQCMIATHADTVERVYCGLGEKIK